MRRLSIRASITGLAVALIGLVLFDFVASAGIRQYRRRQLIRATTEAELRQEPYRNTTWGRELWEETAAYTEQWDPYYVYRVGEMRGRHINVVKGVRATYSAPSSAAAPLVFVFGGSAAWGHGARDLETLPSWIARTAEARGAPLRVRNYAESGWVNWQGIVYLLERLADGERPDVVVFYSGVNEMLSGRQWHQIRRPIFDGELYPAAMRDWMLAKDWPLLRLIDYYRTTSLVWSAIAPRPPATSPATGAEPDLVGRLAREYSADRAVVEALGAQYGFKSIFLWQVTVADKGNLSDQERSYAGWLPASARAEPKLDWWRLTADVKELYQSIGRVVTEHGAVDVSKAFGDFDGTAFIDWMHPSGDGNEWVARSVHDEIVRVLPRRD